MRLRDGRWLGYSDFGPPSGLPLFLLPGMPGSRLLAAHAEDAADEHGFRVIALDRPGIGLSDPKPGRTIRDTAAEVADLADQLAFDRFFVMGVSAGGPHALACAREMPRRVRRVALVSSVVPPAGVPRAPEGSRGRGTSPGSVLREMEHAPPGDRRILARPEVREQLAAAREEAFRLGTQAVVEEGRLTAAPWGFLVEDVTVDVQLWHGEDDLTVPVEAARALAASLPRCHAAFVPGAGHLWHFEHVGDVLSALRAGRHTQ